MQTFDISSNSCRILAHIKHPATYHLHERCFISNMNLGFIIKKHCPHCYNLNIQKHRIMWQNDLYWKKKSLRAPRVFFCFQMRLCWSSHLDCSPRRARPVCIQVLLVPQSAVFFATNNHQGFGGIFATGGGIQDAIKTQIYLRYTSKVFCLWKKNVFQKSGFHLQKTGFTFHKKGAYKYIYMPV